MKEMLQQICIESKGAVATSALEDCQDHRGELDPKVTKATQGGEEGEGGKDHKE